MPIRYDHWPQWHLPSVRSPLADLSTLHCRRFQVRIALSSSKLVHIAKIMDVLTINQSVFFFDVLTENFDTREEFALRRMLWSWNGEFLRIERVLNGPLGGCLSIYHGHKKLELFLNVINDSLKQGSLCVVVPNVKRVDVRSRRGESLLCMD
ncbi:hypothetical protein D9758_015388 [Tetrapyrgos nigripes]|uniref:Uncharacterized protein n=1 Tax=Tetrapyrgos nigripes TaxID=182062 RepID=A0A8H5CA83_9AGAR|nr:hypothetical protein D9758_015388 [Tetrapyrgos nigripes]